MTADRWQQIKTVFEALDAAPHAERPAMLDRLCAGDLDLRREVEALLSADDSTTFIQSAIGEQAAALNPQPAPDDRFGHYRLIRRIGQGGMGAVYEAERVDDFQKKVALKIVRHEFDSDLARTRFQQERQMLAALEHPYIARLLDGGESKDGAPYLVLEFVDGVPLHEYCAALDKRSRLRLFLKVCEAVEHAHRNLVIHRDLKPANILVNGAGDPKLLDFGIAKLLDPASSRTQTVLTALTPDYASPEQVRGHAVSTASDVYALGVILYQLLTNRKPYALETASTFEMDRIICEKPPADPELGDELDHILLTALRKEPERRYGSVHEFAADIERYLDHRPVHAQPDSALYRTRKYARRHWVGLLAASLTLAAICAGAGVALYQAREAKRQFNDVRHLANRFLFDFHDAIVNTPGTVKARELIVTTAQEYLSRLSAGASSDPSLQWELAQAYGKVAAAEGSTTFASLRRPKDALLSYGKGLALARSLDDRHLLDPAQRNVLVNMLCDVEVLHRSLRELDKAETIGREAIARSEGLPPLARGRTMGEMGITLRLKGDLRGSEKALVQLLAASRQNAARDPSFANRLRVATSLLNRANSQTALTRFGPAKASVEEALPLFRGLLTEHPDDARVRRWVWQSIVALGNIEGAGDTASLGNADAAAERYEEALALLNPLISADPNDRAARSDAGLVHGRVAYAVHDTNPALAISHAAIAAAMMDEATPDNTEFRAQPRIAGAEGQRAAGHFADAERLLKKADEILKKRGTDTEVDLRVALGRLEAARGNRQNATAAFEAAVAIGEQLYARARTPANAWALTRSLAFGAAAGGANAAVWQQRIGEVWRDQANRFPQEEYIRARLAGAAKLP